MLWLHKIRPFLFIPILVFLSILFSCNVLNSPQEELLPIEGNIVFAVHEGYSGSISVESPRIILSMVTEKIYPNFNYEIKHEITSFANIISVKLSGIYVPPFLLHAFGPATARSFLDLSKGEYSLSFSYGGITDLYTVSVSDNSIKVKKVSGRLTKPSYDLYWRYPTNSFAYDCRTSGGSSWICEDFLDTLASKIQLIEFQFPDSGAVSYTTWRIYQFEAPYKYFYYHNEADFDKAGEILKTYSKNNLSEAFYITLLNWKNKAYYSWINSN